MSVGSKRQLAANERAFKYQYDLEIIKLKAKLPISPQNSTINFSWKRHQNSIMTKNFIEVKKDTDDIIVNQKLSSISTVCFNVDTKEFVAKESELTVYMNINGSPKKIGLCLIDLRSILNPLDFMQTRTEEFDILIPKTNIKDARIVYRLTSTFHNEVLNSQKSLGVGANGLNSSSFSINQENKFFQRKYEIPSKDSYSVASYNGIRYPSSNKYEKDDNSSVKKDDYGKRQSAGFPSLRSHISNEYSLKNQFQNTGNRTENNDGNYINHQLSDQQNKRSKLESELNKNNLYVEELKKKLTELLLSNTKLKEQLRILSQSKNKQANDQNHSLQNKIYDLNNQNRQLKIIFQTKRQQFDKIEYQFEKLIKQKASQELFIQSLQRKVQESSKNKVEESNKNQMYLRLNENLQKQNHDLKHQVQEGKRQNQESQSKYLNEKYKQSQQNAMKIQFYKKQMEKMKNNSYLVQSNQMKIKELSEQISKLNQEIIIKNSQKSQVQYKLEQIKKTNSQYQSEKLFLQKELTKAKSQILQKRENEKTNKQETEYKMQYYQAENKTLSQKLNQIYREMDTKNKMIMKSQQEKALNDTKTNKLEETINQKCKELFNLNQQNIKYQSQKQDNLIQISRLKEQLLKTNTNSTTNSQEMDKLFRESVQMQVELKYARDELLRLKQYEENFENEQWRAEMESNNRKEIEIQHQKIEKELISKNRALMIESQKNKMLNQQIQENHRALQEFREETQKNRITICNGEKQFVELQQIINIQVNKTKLLTQEMQRLSLEKNRLQNNQEEIRVLHLRIKQMEQRDNEKIHTLENLNENLLVSHNQVKNLQKIAEQRRVELMKRENLICQMESRCKQLQSYRYNFETEVSKILNEKKALEKKNEYMMEEMHAMKKKFEEEKGRSLSFNRNEDGNKVRVMEYEIEKREKTISKLNKEKLQLEEENVKINVQLMKYLSEIERMKANTHLTSVPSSTKIVSGSLNSQK